MKEESLEAIVYALQGGKKCYFNTSTEEVTVIEIVEDEEDMKGVDPKTVIEFVPPESEFTFKLMNDFTAQIDDFEQQSELMEALSYDHPFANFRTKIFQLKLNDNWTEFRAPFFKEWVLAKIG